MREKRSWTGVGGKRSRTRSPENWYTRRGGLDFHESGIVENMGGFLRGSDFRDLEIAVRDLNPVPFSSFMSCRQKHAERLPLEWIGDGDGPARVVRD